MSTFTVEPLYGRKLKMTVNSNGKVIRSYVETFRATCSYQAEQLDVGQQFFNKMGIGSFTRRPTDAVCLCRSIDIQEETNRNPWTYLLTVEWNNDTPGPDQKDRENDDPFSDDVIIESDDELVTFPLFKDRDGTMIANAVGDLIGGVEGERSIEIVRFTRNEPRRDFARDRLYRHAVNSVAYSGADPGTLKCRSIKNRMEYRNQVQYFAYTYEFAYKSDGWQPTLLNAGLYKFGGAGERTPCVDQYNEPVSEPVPLDAMGHQVAAAALPTGATFKTFNTVNSIDLWGLGLPG
jgi:hypothetical protein